MSQTSGKYAFLLRKLHSLSGIIPIGVYLLEHLFSNGMATRGPESFDKIVNLLTGLPFLLVIEFAVIVVPILFHGIYGLFLTYEHQPNAAQYNYYRNWLFHFQRWTGIIMLIYIGWHVYTTRLMSIITGQHMSYEFMNNLLNNPTWGGFAFVFMIIGLASTVFHFSNGVWNFLIKWGITPGPDSQKWSLAFCTVVGWAMFFWGLAALFAMKGWWNYEWFVG
ncbi:MAG: succinate dehydrogenase [bacterium]|jgi:succinate dehydrogenase / fumarate reductase cytochrome b subunit